MSPKENHRLTTSSDETELSSLLSNEIVFNIPYFQRAYKWKPERLRQLEADLLNLVDESTDYHFLGAIILHGRHANPADPRIHEVIDGQQRLTTIFLFICAIVRTLWQEGRLEEAAGLFQKYLVILRPTKLPGNAKLHPCKEDRAQLNRVMTHVMSNAAFREMLGSFQYKPLSDSGRQGGRLWLNYRAALRFFKEQVSQEGVSRLEALYEALLGSMSVVQIQVKNPVDGPKIFDSLNSRQEPMTTGDLVRNEIFSRVASYDPEDVEEIDRRSWQPFYKEFQQGNQNLFDAYFFPYGLVQDPNLRKSEVYGKLRDQWSSIQDPEKIVAELAVYREAFLDAACGTNTMGHAPAVADAIARLHHAKAPGSTFPFMMQFSNAVKAGDIGEKTALAVLDVVESFLVRRAICGHEPTGLHAVFKRLWQDCDGSPTAASVTKAIQRHKTVVWPKDTDVREAIESRPLYGTGIQSHLLIEMNRELGGDPPPSTFWVEHVLPQKPAPEWSEVFSKAEHKDCVDLLANLLPLTQKMNQEVGNAPYPKKRPKYEADSGFKVTRQFAKQQRTWTPKLLQKRSKALGTWAVKRWSH